MILITTSLSNENVTVCCNSIKRIKYSCITPDIEKLYSLFVGKKDSFRFNLNGENYYRRTFFETVFKSNTNLITKSGQDMGINEFTAILPYQIQPEEFLQFEEKESVLEETEGIRTVTIYQLS